MSLGVGKVKGRGQGRRQNKDRKRESIGIVCILLYREGE